MGREVKRVALDFSWPRNQPWKGFLNPYHSQECRSCKNSGYNEETRKLSDDWYGFERPQNRWCNNITQDEVEALIEAGRLYDFVREWKPGQGWIEIVPRPTVTADMVNSWSRKGMGHDSINHWICVEARARRLGVWGKCPVCNGDGAIWFSERVKQLSEAWYENERYEPPAGEGWQVWETVSEGSPITPVFATKEALVDHLVKHGDDWDDRRGDGGWDREIAERFVEKAWAISMISDGNGTILTPRNGA